MDCIMAMVFLRLRPRNTIIPHSGLQYTCIHMHLRKTISTTIMHYPCASAGGKVIGLYVCTVVVVVVVTPRHAQEVK